MQYYPYPPPYPFHPVPYPYEQCHYPNPAGPIPWEQAGQFQQENYDQAGIKLPFGTEIYITRRYGQYLPHEISAFIPRLECRYRVRDPLGNIIREKEYILSSITLVHAPLHPQSGEERVIEK